MAQWLVSLVVPGNISGQEPVYTVGSGSPTALSNGTPLQANSTLYTRAGMIQVVERDNGQAVRTTRVGPNSKVYLEGPATQIPRQVMTIAGERQVPAINKQGEFLSLQQGAVADGNHRPNCYQMQAQIVYSSQTTAEPVQYETYALNGTCSIYTYDNSGLRVPFVDVPVGYKQTMDFNPTGTVSPTTPIGPTDFVAFSALINPATWP